MELDSEVFGVVFEVEEVLEFVGGGEEVDFVDGALKWLPLDFFDTI